MHVTCGEGVPPWAWRHLPHIPRLWRVSASGERYAASRLRSATSRTFWRPPPLPRRETTTASSLTAEINASLYKRCTLHIKSHFASSVFIPRTTLRNSEKPGVSHSCARRLAFTASLPHCSWAQKRKNEKGLAHEQKRSHHTHTHC